MNKSHLEEQVVSDNPLEVLAHDYAFLYNIKTNRNGFSNESNHKSFIRKHEGLKAQALAQFEANYEHMFKKYQALRKQYPGMLQQMQQTESLEEMAYQKPNFEKVWDQVSQNSYVNSLGMEKWIELAQSGKDSKISLPSMDNVLDYDPSVKGKDNVKHSHVDMPIILKSPMGDYHLLNGNDTLNAIMNMHGNAKVWYIDASQAEA
jgi:hypothetical protein